MRISPSRAILILLCLCILAVTGIQFNNNRAVEAAKSDAGQQNLLPTGKRITPLATRGAHFETLNPELPEFPHYRAGQAMSTAVDRGANTLLILTSGFNRVKDKDDKTISDASTEYAFVFDIAGAVPRKKQVLKVPNTFAGIAFAPDGGHFYVAGGKDDNLHLFRKDNSGRWQENGQPIKLGHSRGGLGLVPGEEPLASAGVAVTGDGKFAAVANLYNDSVTVVDLNARLVAAEIELRPGKSNPSQSGVPGGEYPFWVVAKGDDTFYASSLRDREIVEMRLGTPSAVVRRIHLRGNPSKMILNRDQSRLYVTADNSDTVTVIDTSRNEIVEEIPTTAPDWLLKNVKGYTGSAPNDLALSMKKCFTSRTADRIQWP